MAYNDLQDFIRYLDEKGLLKKINAEVDSELEITEIADRVSKQYGPALLFEKVKGSPYPVLINAMGTFERMSMALGAERLDDIGSRIEEFFQSLMSPEKTAEMLPIRLASRGTCQEVIEEDPDLNTLPILKCWPGDAGRFITLPLVITKDPETNIQNMGMYRMQIFDKNTTGMHWHMHKDGREIYGKYKKTDGRMPVSVALGCDPAVTYSAAAPLPKAIDEMLFAGFLRKQPVPLVKSITSDLYVPAEAEFILEGYVDVNEDLRPEGPCANHTGYYSRVDCFPVFHVTCITHKKNAVYPTTIVGKPPMEDCYIGKANERIFLPLLKRQHPEIVDLSSPLEGVFNNCVIVSIQKSYPGHAKKIMEALWDMRQMMHTKMIIVVDDSVSPHEISTVAWKVFNNIDAKRDIVISEGPLDALDHASSLSHYGHRLGIDATKKWPDEGHDRDWPDDIEMSPEIKKLVSRRWTEYGIE